PKAFLDHQARDPPRLRELGQQMFGALDGAGDELWKKRDISEKLDEIARRFHLSAINVNGITHRLEGVEGNTDRQDHPKSANLEGNTQILQDSREGFDEEIVIFKKTENRKIGDDTEATEKLSPTRILNPIEAKADTIIQQTGDDEQSEKSVMRRP